MLCDSCPAAYHPECLGLTLQVGTSTRPALLQTIPHLPCPALDRLPPRRPVPASKDAVYKVKHARTAHALLLRCQAPQSSTVQECRVHQRRNGGVMV